jgi:hypothetical protein
MADVEERFRSVRTMKTPDLWGDIESRTPRAPLPDPPLRRVTAATVALALAAAGILIAVRAFTGPTGSRVGDEPTTSGPPRPVLGPSVDIGLPDGGPFYAFGSVWIGSLDQGHERESIVRIDPSTLEVIARIPVESAPDWEVGEHGFAEGFGSLWVTGGDGREALVQRVDPVTNAVVGTIRLEGESAGDVAVADSELWVSVLGGGGNVYVARIDAITSEVTARVPVSGDWIREVFPFDDRIVVRTRGGGAVNTLTVIDAATAELVASESTEEAIFTASNGSVWAGAGDRLLRIDPGTAEVVDSVPVGSQITYTSMLWRDDGLWFIGYDSDATGDASEVMRFNPTTGEIDASVDAPPTPVAMASGEDALWVLGYQGRLTRIDLES